MMPPLPDPDGSRPPGSRDRAVRLFFRIGVIGKGVDGVLELLGGVLLYFVDPAALQNTILLLTQHELTEEPHDLIATTLVNLTRDFSPSAQTFGALYLLSHGVIKLTLVMALLRQRLWAYPVAILVFLPFLLYQVYRYTLTLAPMLLVLSVADLVVIVLTILEYQRQRRVRSATGG